MTRDITDITARQEQAHRNLSMCVEIASMGIEVGQVTNMVSAIKLVRRTPWGRQHSVTAIKGAIHQSRILAWSAGSWRV